MSIGEDYYRRDAFADYWIPFKADKDARARFMSVMHPEVEVSPSDLLASAEAFDGDVVAVARVIEKIAAAVQEEPVADLNRTPLESAARETADFVARYLSRFNNLRAHRNFRETIRELKGRADWRLAVEEVTALARDAGWEF